MRRRDYIKLVVERLGGRVSGDSSDHTDIECQRINLRTDEIEVDVPSLTITRAHVQSKARAPMI